MNARLITIGISHYCEVARWALQYAGVDFREERHLQGFHRRVLRPMNARTVPVLVLPDRVLTETYDILQFAHTWAVGRGRHGLLETPKEQESTREILANFGPPVRLFFYHYAFQLPKSEILPTNNRGAPWWQRVVFRLSYDKVESIMRQYYAIDDASAAEAIERCRATLDDVAARLSDGRRYLCGHRFSAADLSFAAMAAPLAAPPEHPMQLPPSEAWSAPMRDALARFDEHPALEFVRRLYREHRYDPSQHAAA